MTATAKPDNYEFTTSTFEFALSPLLAEETNSTNSFAGHDVSVHKTTHGGWLLQELT